MIFRKLRSQAGASLIAALFLTLFCAMVGTVLLTAASANAGRLSKRNERDHDYYKVMSAAKLFADTLRGKTVGVISTRSGDGMTDYQYDVLKYYEFQRNDAGEWVPISDNDAVDKFLMDAVKEIYEKMTVEELNEGVAEVLTPEESDAKRQANREARREKYWYNDFSDIIDGKSDPAKITMTVSGDALSAEVCNKCAVQGRIALQGWNCVLKAVFSTAMGVTESGGTTNPDKLPKDAYFVQMVCVPDVSWNYPSGEDGENVETKTIAFTWNNVQIMEGR